MSNTKIVFSGKGTIASWGLYVDNTHVLLLLAQMMGKLVSGPITVSVEFDPTQLKARCLDCHLEYPYLSEHVCSKTLEETLEPAVNGVK
jgi:hypothetical protein